MMIRRQDLSVLLLYLVGYSKIRNLIFRIRRRPMTRFVTFHDVPRQSLDRFEANLRFLKEHANVITIDDFMQGRLSVEKINVGLTFDDGYKSWVTGVSPILKKLELPATFFVTSGFVGLSGEEGKSFMRARLLLPPDADDAVSGLGEDDVKRLADDGFAIGGHTVNHANLAEIRDSGSLRREIADDKCRLEAIAGTRIDYFAYPFGACRNPWFDLEEILKDCGYRGAVTTISGLNRHDTNSYFLHRELTPAFMSEWVFRARASGNYDAIRFLKRQLG